MDKDLLVFFELFNALQHKDTHVYVHCKSGKDRSAFTVFAFLRLMFRYSWERASAALDRRVGVDGRPVADLVTRKADLTNWLEAEVAALE